jgi:5-methyltetrahydrofolate--homocysteine methyltransferase
MDKQLLVDLLKERILILDGGLGTMIQKYKLSESDYRGTRFASSPGIQKGNNDILSITKPEVIEAIHRQYLEAGADIFATNTFNANAISMEDYGMEAYVREMNIASARIARNLVDQYNAAHPERVRFVAGSIGPTNKTASISPDVNDPAFRAVTYNSLYAAYTEQIEALIEGGVDIILFETTFDTLNVKAGLEAAENILKEKQLNLPIMLSLTLSSQGGRTLTGQTLTAFLASIQNTSIVSIGLNCSFGAVGMKPYIAELTRLAPYYISAYPNAGLPNSFGEYDETPERMASHVKGYIDEGLVNIIGGCCGTTPEHIAQYKSLVADITPRIPAQRPDSLWLSGLELLEIKPENNFINVGERCNVAGSRKFLRLIKEKKYDEALSIARKQVEDGAQVIDVNMHEAMLEAEQEMITFLNLIASEPDIARVPLMIDSSKWDVIEAGLKCVQGKSIVNSISLKAGEDHFLAQAQRVKQLGAAVVVMAFDEQGQADSYERKIEVCARAYHLLVDKIQFNPQDIIFDPNILAIATGIEEHASYGLAFIESVQWIKTNLPSAKVSGGVSNLSFSFRGNNFVREAMHSVFLYHAIQVGMDMGIVNPSTAMLYDDIEISFRELIEDVVLNRRPEATEALIAYAETHKNEKSGTATISTDVWREQPLTERLSYALVRGIGDFLPEDLEEALKRYPRAVSIIDGPLMEGMNEVGRLFGEGKMFLPQVVKTARTMKRAVAILQPAIEEQQVAGGSTKAGKILFATVKGDVHDIGKNICSIILACNNFEVIDLGVMVPADVIIQKAIEIAPDFICLSGLITPSLDEMAHVAAEMEKANLSIPLMVGGATTSKLHTAVKIAPHYSHPVIHVADAAQTPLVITKYLHLDTRAELIESISQEYAALREAQPQKQLPLVSLAEARAQRLKLDWENYQPTKPAQLGRQVIPFIPFETIRPYIHWSFFFMAWKLNPRFEAITKIHGCDACRASWLAGIEEEIRPKAAEAMQLFKDAQRLLDYLESINAEYIKAVYGIYEASTQEDTLTLGEVSFPLLRQQAKRPDGVYKSLADYVMPSTLERTDYAGAFIVTAGAGAEHLYKKYEEAGDTYNLMLLQTLTDRLAEAATEYLHQQIRTTYWGYAPTESCSMEDLYKVNYQGIRPAIGYPSLPDQLQTYRLNQLLDAETIGVKLTENGALTPSATVCGLMFAHPATTYFQIGKIDNVQLTDYAERSGTTPETIRKWLIRNID